MVEWFYCLSKSETYNVDFQDNTLIWFKLAIDNLHYEDI